MRIRTKLIANNVLLVALVVLAGGVGIVDLAEQTRTVAFITGPSWGSADAAMETSISVGENIVAIDRLVDGTDVQGNQQRLHEGRAKVAECLRELRQHGLVPDGSIDKAERLAAQLDAAGDALLAARDKVVTSRAGLDDNDELLDSIAVKLAEAGEAALAARASDADKPPTWQDLEPLSAAIDAARQVRIHALEQRAWLAGAENEADPKRVRPRIEALLAEQRQTFARVQDAAVFGERAGEAEGLTKAYTGMLESRAQIALAYIDQLSRLRQLRLAFEKSAGELVAELHTIEEQCDGRVDQAKAEADTASANATSTLYVTITVSVLFAAVVAFLLVGNLGRRLGGLEARLRDIAAGDGDLTVRIASTAKDELGAIAGWFDQFLTKLQTIVKNIATTAGHVATGAAP